MNYPKPIAKLIESYMKLPGIDQETATRLASYTVDIREEDANAFTKALISVKKNLHLYSICGDVTEKGPCEICQDKNRDRSIISVMEEPKDAISVGEMREYQGLHHILHGMLSPMEGTGPEDTNIASLIKRLYDDEAKEAVVAANTTTEGEAAAMYLSRLIRSTGVTVTRLAHGLSVGNDTECADEITLLKAAEGRREIQRKRH